MRWFYMIIVLLFVAAVAIFAFQNLQMVTISFLGFSARAPVAVIAAILYVLGMVTGSSLFAWFRRSLRRAKR